MKIESLHKVQIQLQVEKVMKDGGRIPQLVDSTSFIANAPDATKAIEHAMASIGREVRVYDHWGAREEPQPRQVISSTLKSVEMAFELPIKTECLFYPEAV